MMLHQKIAQALHIDTAELLQEFHYARTSQAVDSMIAFGGVLQ